MYQNYSLFILSQPFEKQQAELQLSYQQIFAGQVVSNTLNNTLVQFLGKQSNRVLGSICDGPNANATFEHEAITTGDVEVEVLENYF